MVARVANIVVHIGQDPEDIMCAIVTPTWHDPGTTGQFTGHKSLCVLIRIQESKHFLLVNRLVGSRGSPAFRAKFVC